MNPKKFDTEEELQELREAAEMHCTFTEMAHMFGCSRELFYTRKDLMELIETARASTKTKMRKLMIKRALYDGNDEYLLGIGLKALVHCHTWYLGHRDNVQNEIEEGQNKFLPPAAELDDKANGD